MVKTLGLLWNAETDELQYKATLTDIKIGTKRSILSNLARIYDPLGIIGPIIKFTDYFTTNLANELRMGRRRTTINGKNLENLLQLFRKG